MSKVTNLTSVGTIGANLQPKRYDIVLYQGDTFAFNLAFKNGTTPIDITGWEAQAQIRKVADNTSATPPEMTVDLSRADEGIMTLSISDTGTDTLEEAVKYHYDVQVSDGVSKRTYIGGEITVTGDITEWV